MILSGAIPDKSFRESEGAHCLSKKQYCVTAITLLCCSIPLCPLLPRISQGCFLPSWWDSLPGLLEGSRAVPNMSQPPPCSLLPPWLCRVVTSSQKYLYKATSQCLTISCAWYKLQIIPCGTRQWEARDLLQISLWEHAFGSSAVGNFIFRGRGVRVFTH